METPDTYRQRAEAAERSAEAAADEQAKQMLRKVSERWRQLAGIAQRILDEERKQL